VWYRSNMALSGRVKVIAGLYRGFTGIIIQQKDKMVHVEFDSGLSMWFEESCLEVVR
jgi:hypothetical protein